MTKSIVLCADDYGQAPAIIDGILALIIEKRLSAVSCMVNTPHWYDAATALMEFVDHFDIGLHFNLTEGEALSTVYQRTYGKKLMPLGRLMTLSFLRQINVEAIEAELEAQLDSFQAATSLLPRFIDGHQHVHQFPVIRQAFVNVYMKRLTSCSAYVRLSNPPVRSLKQAFIHANSRAFSKLLKKNNIPHNQSFSGSYSFNVNEDYRGQFLRFLGDVGEKGMIMCHPALKSPYGEDAIAQARFNEYLYLASDQFLEDCSLRGVKIEQF